MKSFRFFLVLPLLSAGFLTAQTGTNEPVLPEKLLPQLEAILATAVRQSPRMINRALDLEIAENDRIQARAGLLPNAGGYANYFESRDTRADLAGRLNVTKIAYNFSITQPVFFWGERLNSAKIGEIQASIAKGQYQDGYRAFAQTLRAEYLRLIVQKLALKRAIFYRQYTKNQLQKEEARLATKVISDFQIFPIRLAAEQAQIAMERTQFDFEMAKLSFARLSGQPVLTDDSIPDVIPTATYRAGAYDQLLAGFLSSKDLPTIEAMTLRKQLQIDELGYSNMKVRLRPKFSAVLGMSQDEQSYTINVAEKFRVNSIYGGISASWTLFDGFAASAAKRNGLARLRQKQNDYKDLTERLAQQAQTQVKQINFAARSMAITDQAMISSEGNLKGKQDEFGRGVSSEDDVTLARLVLFDAQLNALNNRMDFLYRTAEFLGTVVQDPVVANVAANK